MNFFDDYKSSDSDEYFDNHSDEYYDNRSIEFRHAEVEKLAMPSGGRLSNDRRKPFAPAPTSTPDIGSVGKAVSEYEYEISVTREKLMMEFKTEAGKVLQEAILKNNSETQHNMPPPNGGEINAAVEDPVSENKLKRPRRNLEKKEERAKFSIALSRKEIEDDFITTTGKKPPRKPNKRPKNIQIRLQCLYPGSRLCEVHHDLYK